MVDDVCEKSGCEEVVVSKNMMCLTLFDRLFFFVHKKEKITDTIPVTSAFSFGVKGLFGDMIVDRLDDGDNSDEERHFDVKVLETIKEKWKI